MATTQNGIYYQDDYTKSADILADMKEMAESIDEVVQEEKENQETIEQKIQELQAEQATQNQKIEQLDDNQIHITTEKSSNINVKDASGQNAKIKLFGISRQKISVQGNNILDLSRPLLEGKRYNEQGNEEVDSRANTYSLKLEDGVTYFISIATGGSYYTKWKNNVFVSYEVKNPGTVQETKDDTFDEIRYSLFTDTNNFGTSYINKNSNTGYEEFVPDSPSPKYPSEIENVTEDIDITVCDKNLINWNKIITDSQNVTNEGEYVKFYQSANRLTIKDIFKENTQYAFTITAKKDIANGNLQLYFSYTDGSTETIKIVCTNANTDYKQTFISQANKTIDFIQSTYTDETASYIKIERTQLEVNNVATDYIENEQQTITFPLAQNQKMYEGSYLADDGIHHKRKQIVLDGTEDWVLSGSIANNQYILNIPDIKIIGENNKGNLISSHFKEITGVEGYNNNNINGISGWGSTQIRISLDISIINRNVAKFKNWLAQQKANGTPVTIEYPLAEETIEEYTEEQQTQRDQLQNAKTYKTVTNVFTENAELEMEYIADTKTYIDNKVKNMQNQLNTINELLSTTTTSAMLLDNMQTDLESEVL